MDGFEYELIDARDLGHRLERPLIICANEKGDRREVFRFHGRDISFALQVLDGLNQMIRAKEAQYGASSV